MNSYKEASEMLGKRTHRKLANNTYLELHPQPEPARIAVRLHDTDIITFYPRRVVLNSGGWKTPTTKDRLNRFMPEPYHIIQEKGLWYVYLRDWQGKRLCIFRDGMVITGTGKILHAGKIGAEDKKLLSLRSKVSKYAAAFVAALQSGDVPKPSSGDCWYCSLSVTSPEKDKGKTLGEACSKDCGHIISHIEESYFVPSLLIRAMEKVGAGPGWYWDLQAKWEGKRALDKWHLSKYRRWIKRYCFSQLGLVR